VNTGESNDLNRVLRWITGRVHNGTPVTRPGGVHVITVHDRTEGHDLG
jgi:hypothetical protein